MMETFPKILLRLEALIIFISSLYVFYLFEGKWWVFLLFFLAPDIGLLGYRFNKEFGSSLYNVLHTYPVPLAFIGLSYLNTFTFGIHLGAIWFSHIALDRVFGYGLKYPSSSRYTHLHKV